jgi:hypothetical protein
LVNGHCVKINEDKPSCSGGRYFSKSSNACRCPSKRPVWTGSRCKKSFTVSCSRGRVFSASAGSCVCPSSRPHFYGGQCRANRDCPGDSELVSGKCVKVRVPYVIVTPGKPKPKKPTIKDTLKKLGNDCGLLNAACKLGSKSSCRKFNSQC